MGRAAKLIEGEGGGLADPRADPATAGKLLGLGSALGALPWSVELHPKIPAAVPRLEPASGA